MIKTWLNFFFNCCLAEYYYIFRKANVINRPRIWAIELTNFCDLNCLMCPRKYMKRKVGYMDFDLFKSIINQIKDYTNFVWLHNYGESIFHPKIEQFINYCAENNIKPGLSTNAAGLDEKKAVMLLNSMLDRIVLSIDGSVKETYQKLRGGGDFDKTRSNILNFLKLKRKLNKTGPFAEVQMIRIEETNREIDIFKKQWKDLADNVVIKDFSARAGQVEEISKIKRQEQLFFSRRKKRYPCMAFWRDGVVLWNGDVVPCCMDFDGKMILGNLNKEKLKDIWNSEKMIKIRKEQDEGNYDNPLCKNCTEWLGRQTDIYYLFYKVLPYAGRYFKRLV